MAAATAALDRLKALAGAETEDGVVAAWRALGDREAGLRKAAADADAEEEEARAALDARVRGAAEESGGALPADIGSSDAIPSTDASSSGMTAEEAAAAAGISLPDAASAALADAAAADAAAARLEAGVASARGMLACLLARVEDAGRASGGGGGGARRSTRVSRVSAGLLPRVSTSTPTARASGRAPSGRPTATAPGAADVVPLLASLARRAPALLAAAAARETVAAVAASRPWSRAKSAAPPSAPRAKHRRPTGNRDTPRGALHSSSGDDEWDGVPTRDSVKARAGRVARADARATATATALGGGANP